MNAMPFGQRNNAYQGAAVAGVNTDTDEDNGISARLQGFGDDSLMQNSN